MDMFFVYLVHGPRTDVPTQLKYSLYTLLRHVPSARGNVLLYTDAPQRYAHWPVDVVPLDDVIAPYGKTIAYHFILKPLVLLDAVRRFHRPVVFIDADTWVSDGFEADIFWKLRAGAFLNAFEKSNPYPELTGFCASLPHTGAYAYDPDRSCMYNSGVIGLGGDAEPILEDTISLTEALLASPLRAHTMEQLAISEVLRVRGIETHECDRYLFHYHRRSLKRYVTMKIAKLLPSDWNDFDIRGAVALNPVEKYLYDLRHGLEKRRDAAPSDVTRLEHGRPD